MSIDMFRGCEDKVGFFYGKKYCLCTQLLNVCPISGGHQICGHARLQWL